MTNLDLTFKITVAKLVGNSGKYIVLRVIQKDIRINATEDFKIIEIDALQILRNDKDSKWKLRTSHILDAKQLD